MFRTDRKSLFENSRLLQRAYPNLGNGFSQGLTLKEVAEKIKNYNPEKNDENPELKIHFKNYSIKTLIHFIRHALAGCEYNGEVLEGLMGDRYYQIYSKRKIEPLKKGLEKKLGVVPWKNEEEDFLIDLYSKNISLREIYSKYKTKENFTYRSYSSVENKLAELRKKKKIRNQKINWGGDIGFFALALLERYGKEGNFLVENSKSLDEYFYKGKGVITKQKLNNFYRRERWEEK